MFCVSHFIANQLVEHEKVTLYSSVLSIVVYSLCYIYLMFFQPDFFQIFNKYIVYVLAIDLLLTALLHFYQKYASPSDTQSECSEDSILEEEYDLYSQLDHLESESHHQEPTHPQTHQEPTHPQTHQEPTHPQTHQEPTHPQTHPQTHQEPTHPLETIVEIPEIVIETPESIGAPNSPLVEVVQKKQIVRKRRTKKIQPELTLENNN